VKGDNAIVEKSYQFAIPITNLYLFLSAKKKEFVLSKQLLRSGTSIGANVEEAQGGQSKADFYAKMSIAYKEARETKYWLRILKDTNFLTTKQFTSI
jgi:four helix bundle protein